MSEHPLIEATKDFLKAITDAENDECICLNVGYHDLKILDAWRKIQDEAEKIPLLSGECEWLIQCPPNSKGDTMQGTFERVARKVLEWNGIQITEKENENA